MTMSPKDFTLVIELDSLVAWAPINNTFADHQKSTRVTNDRWPENRPYWRGLLIQLGQYKLHGAERTVHDERKKYTEGDPMGDVFDAGKSIRFCRDRYRDGEEILTLSKAEISNTAKPIWINVAPLNAQTSKPPIIVWNDLRLLGFPKSSLRFHFDPHPCWITLWHSEREGFIVRGQQVAHHNRNLAYTFTLTGGPFQVGLFENGSPKTLQDTDRIVISAQAQCRQGLCSHGEEKNPTEP